MVDHSATHGCSAVWSQGNRTPCLVTQSSRECSNKQEVEVALAWKLAQHHFHRFLLTEKPQNSSRFKEILPLNGTSSIFNLPQWIKVVPFLQMTTGELRLASAGASKKLDDSREDPRRLQTWSTVSAWLTSAAYSPDWCSHSRVQLVFYERGSWWGLSITNPSNPFQFLQQLENTRSIQKAIKKVIKKKIDSKKMSEMKKQKVFAYLNSALPPTSWWDESRDPMRRAQYTEGTEMIKDHPHFLTPFCILIFQN